MAKEPGKDKDEALSEALFEQYLDGESAVSEAYRALEQAEPPAGLDRKVLAEAQAALRPRRKSLLDLDLEFWRHWARPVSTVVIMGVCLTVVLRVMDYEILIPGPPQDAEFAIAEQKQAQVARPEQSDSPDAAAAVAGSAGQSRRLSAGLAQMAPRDQVIESPAEPPREQFDTMDSETVMEEITVMARKRSETLQEVPMAVTSLQNQEIVVTARKSQEEADEFVRAADALQAWEQGARPAAEVWRAGIETVFPGDEIADIPDDQREYADIELARLALAYPAEARQLEERYDRLAEAGSARAMQGKFIDRQASASAEIEMEADSDLAFNAEAVDPVADPLVWAAGIEWLYENDRDSEAEAELAKFRQIYPDFDVD